MLKRQTVFLLFFDLLNKIRKWQNAKWCRMHDFQVPGCESITGWQDYQMLCRTTRVARTTQWQPIPRYVPPRRINWTIDGGGLTAISPPQGRGRLPAGSLPTNRNHFQSIIIIFSQCLSNIRLISQTINRWRQALGVWQISFRRARFPRTSRRISGRE